MTAEFLDTENKVKLIIHNAEELSNIWLPTWSKENGQDDIIWYSADKREDGTWTCIIDVLPEESYIVHVYTGESSPEMFLAQYVF